MTDKPVIPKSIYERIAVWLRGGGTGRIVLDAHQGRIQSAEISDRFRADDDPVVPIDVPRVGPLKTR